MELRQLAYVVAIAETGGFTAAASREHVAQPAVSAQVAALERELGHQLFRRTPRGAVPTEAGVELLRHARRVLGGLDDARTAMAELAGLVRGRVTVGLVRGAPLGRLGSCLGRFRQTHPGVAVAVREGESADLLAALGTGELDLALAGLAGRPPAGVTAKVVLTSAAAAFVPPGDRWQRRRSVELAELCGRPLTTLVAGTGVRTALDDACRTRGLVPELAGEVGTVGAAAELARAGVGVAVLPGDGAAAVAPDLHRVAIRPVVRSRLVLAWATDTPRHGRSAARTLLADVLAAYRGPGQDAAPTA